MDKSPTVWARGITQSFGDVVALDGVDVEGASGQIHGPAGLNYAGTTLLGPASAQAIYQLDVTADRRYVADGDGPKEVNELLPGAHLDR